MVDVNEERCAALGLDARRVASIARRLAAVAEDARQAGLVLFGAPGVCLLRKSGGAQNDVAEVPGPFDGGDGGDSY